MRLRVRKDRCTGCRICTTYCSFHHERMIWPSLARVRVEAETDSGPFSPQVCRQCDAHRASEDTLAPCAAACPVEAIRLEERTGAWIISLEVCTGCRACEEACPFGMIIFDPGRGLALKCDLCGGEPECAAMCVSGAIEVRAR